MAQAGLILAGGRGERFGGPKAFAELPDGRTFLAACVHVLRQAGAHPVLATLPCGSTDPGLDGLVSLALPEPDLDMFASLREGLGWLLGEPAWQVVVVHPVDHPLVRSATVVALAARVGGAVQAARPSFLGKHGHPIVLARVVAESVIGGDLPGPTLREVLRAVSVSDVPVDDPGVCQNLNSRMQLDCVLRRAGEDA